MLVAGWTNREQMQVDKEDQYWKPVGALMPSSKQWAQPKATSPARVDLDRSAWINARAQMVLSAYRRDDFADPDSFRLQLGMVLERYPDPIIEDGTSPLTGIQRYCKFPPSIAEVVAYFDEMKHRATYAADWDARSRQQLEERKRT